MVNEFKVDPQEIKQKLGENTQKLERKASEFWFDYSPHYTNLEPWQRGLLLIGIVILLAVGIYYLTKKDKSRTAIKKAQAEAALEDKIIKRMELLKKLRE